MRRAFLAAFLALPVAAHADTIFTLGNSNDTGTSGPGPYATLDVALTSPTTATLTYTRVGSFVFGEMGGNLNASSFTIGPVSFLLAPSSNQTPTFTASSGSLDGFGNFSVDQVSNPNGFSAAVIEASFTVTDTSGTWASSDAVLTPDNKGFEAAVHAFTATGGSFFAANSSSCTGATCNPPPPPPPPIPEPGTLALLGAGLLGLAGARYRFMA